jgi:hypothetical protein
VPNPVVPAVPPPQPAQEPAAAAVDTVASGPTSETAGQKVADQGGVAPETVPVPIPSDIRLRPEGLEQPGWVEADAAAQAAESPAPVSPDRVPLGDPVFTARTPEPRSRTPLIHVPEQRGGDQAGVALAAPDEIDPSELQGKRVRVVLAERKSVARPVRTVVDVQEGTGVGEFLAKNLIRTQLTIALRFAVGALLTLGLLPVAFAFMPEIGLIDVLGIRLPWVLLGFLVYPFLLGLGFWHIRLAERVEHHFADDVQG